MTPFLGQCMAISWNFPPRGWQFCNGALLPINQNQALFSLLGTTFGGDGRTTFGLPDLRSRTPLGFGNGAGLSPYNMGEVGGQEAHTLSIQEVPQHFHMVQASTNATTLADPSGAALGQVAIYNQSQAPNTPMSAASLTNAGGSQAHENRQPFLVINWVIALTGVFPSRT